MDLEQLFWDIDDFWRSFEPQWQRAMLPGMDRKRRRSSTLSMSEVMTMIVNFHASSYRNFKHYSLKAVIPHLHSAFPKLVSYNRFVELKQGALIPLLCYLHTRKGEGTGISFIDATFLDVCQPVRAKRHRVFEPLAQWGKNAIRWHFGFKLHLLMNEQGDLLGFQLTPANVDDRKPVPDLVTGIIGKLFGDQGYISEE